MATKHGDRPKGKRKRLYNIWLKMRERCTNEHHVHYQDYGGRGITVCSEWEDYRCFREWAYRSGYSDDLTLDRINTNLGYYPENCKWSTRKEQANNRRSNRVLTLNGESHNITWWVEKTGLSRHVIDGRVKRGWDDYRILTTPLLTKGGKPTEQRNRNSEQNPCRP